MLYEAGKTNMTHFPGAGYTSAIFRCLTIEERLSSKQAYQSAPVSGHSSKSPLPGVAVSHRFLV
jgi:hypothetical protein